MPAPEDWPILVEKATVLRNRRRRRPASGRWRNSSRRGNGDKLAYCSVIVTTVEVEFACELRRATGVK